MSNISLDDLMNVEKIFLPVSAKRRQEIFPIVESDTISYADFAHYTSAEAAFNIIKTRCFWMRDISCMSDYREIHHGRDALTKYFSDQNNRNDFINALKSCDIQDNYLNEINEFLDEIINNDPPKVYITSFSEHVSQDEDLHGRLSMWRGFGANINKVAIVFKIPSQTRAREFLKIRFSPVSYIAERKIPDQINEIVNKIMKEKIFLKDVHLRDGRYLPFYAYAALISILTCFKHEGFQEEKEWRAVYFPYVRSNFMKQKLEVIDGVPQIIYQLPMDNEANLADISFSKIFKRLIIGPSPYAVSMKEAFEIALKNAGIKSPEDKVVVSEIPIRKF